MCLYLCCICFFIRIKYATGNCITLFILTFFSAGALSSSSILDCNVRGKYLLKLNSFLVPVLQSPSRSRFVKCWRAKTDGWSLSTFHSNCDGKGPTVTIIEVGSYIFGGYIDASWLNPPQGKNPLFIYVYLKG